MTYITNDTLGTITATANNALSNPLVAGGLGAVGGAVVGSAATYAITRRKTRKKRKSARKSVRKRNTRSKRRRYSPRTAGKRKDTSHKRIRYTKNGQPYIILNSGKARFIKMSSAKSSHRRKGGRY